MDNRDAMFPERAPEAVQAPQVPESTGNPVLDELRIIRKILQDIRMESGLIVCTVSRLDRETRKEFLDEIESRTKAESGS